MKINSLELNIMYCKTTQKSYFTKVLSVAITLFFVALIFSSIASGSAQSVENQDDSRHQNLHNLFSDLIAFRRGEGREIIPLHVVTRYQNDGSLNIIEKSTRMRLLLPTSIDVDGDHRKDIRVWSFRRLALDLNPPAIAIKTTFIIRRLPGMNDIKNDFLEIYLEYMPKVATKFFYLTKDIDRIRLGYQSPAGEEIPKTCIITDKAMPHILYPKKKTTHKISVNPGSIIGEEQLNLLFSLANVEDETVASELIMQVNYTPAIKIKEITFEREKNKLIGRGQNLEITRTSEPPSNVTLFIRELFWKGLRIVNQSSLTVENIPKKINLSWVLGRTGYITLDTHNDAVGRVKAVINNTVIICFVPETSMKGRISWENRTIIGMLTWDVFDMSFDIYETLSLQDFSLRYISPESALIRGTLDINASSLSLELDAGIDFGSVTAQYWLFPVSQDFDTTIDIDIKNLKLEIENFAVDVEVTEYRDWFIKAKNGNNTMERTLQHHTSMKHFTIKAEDARIFSTSLMAFNITSESKGKLDLYIEDAQSLKNEIIFMITMRHRAHPLRLHNLTHL